MIKIIQRLNRSKKDMFQIRIEETFKETIYTPMVKKVGWFTQWQQIVKIYNKYYISEIPGQHGLTQQDCIDHIVNYQQQLVNEQIQGTVKITNVDYNF